MIGVDTFSVGQLVDVSGTTKGRGFSGVIRRHHFSSNRASHGNSLSHNTPGSISMAQDPGRVFPGKRMAGHYGSETRTIQTLPVVRVDKERGLLLVKGSVPGADGGLAVAGIAVGDTGTDLIDAGTLGAPIQGQFGKLTLGTDGTYSYTHDIGLPGVGTPGGVTAVTGPSVLVGCAIQEGPSSPGGTWAGTAGAAGAVASHHAVRARDNHRA